jgi:hypothetical protein
MPDLAVWWYRFAVDRIWKHNRRAVYWGEHASAIWYGMTPAQRRKAARARSPF